MELGCALRHPLAVGCTGGPTDNTYKTKLTYSLLYLYSPLQWISNLVQNSNEANILGLRGPGHMR